MTSIYKFSSYFGHQFFFLIDGLTRSSLHAFGQLIKVIVPMLSLYEVRAFKQKQVSVGERSWKGMAAMRMHVEDLGQTEFL